METKYLSLRYPVELGSRFDDWQVCLLGGWNKHRHFYLVMLVKIALKKPFTDGKIPAGKRMGLTVSAGRLGLGGLDVAQRGPFC
jgi:hypothetical protein